MKTWFIAYATDEPEVFLSHIAALGEHLDLIPGLCVLKSESTVAGILAFCDKLRKKRPRNFFIIEPRHVVWYTLLSAADNRLLSELLGIVDHRSEDPNTETGISKDA